MVEAKHGLSALEGTEQGMNHGVDLKMLEDSDFNLIVFSVSSVVNIVQP